MNYCQKEFFMIPEFKSYIVKYSDILRIEFRCIQITSSNYKNCHQKSKYPNEGLFNFNMNAMTKFVCPIKYNRIELIDDKTIINIRTDRRYRVDRPKDVTQFIRQGVNKV